MVGICTNRESVQQVRCQVRGPGATAMVKHTVRWVSRCPGVGAAWRPFFLPIEGAADGLGAGMIIRTRCKILHSQKCNIC